ncbi:MULTISPECIES: M48 family metallopeptidase [Roseinatronobacter]|uniref:M48 family metallopeptidase n=1 Tax=Roseinatronobacter domitianus TaxID=2940293 RepID=A0ABT0LZD1_9RHOB|nr:MULTISPECIES: SprT family zinc-dependent metalloprotease [Roseibaca]MCL1627972.1 M48 family metallopeptidase [Roseibaca domitiana]
MPQLTETVVLPGEPALRVQIKASARARQMSLRVSGLDGKITLNVPRGLAHRHALAFLSEKEGWLRAAVARAPGVQPIAPGGLVPVDGILHRVTPAPVRSVTLKDDRLLVPETGPAGARVAAFLKTRARDRLVPMADHYAQALGRTVAAVSLRDTRSRWGSCTAQGRLMFCWRLAMAPPIVQDYVAAHEAAHLVHMDHSRAYWATVARIMPDYAAHRAWLRSHGATLHSYRFDNG